MSCNDADWTQIYGPFNDDGAGYIMQVFLRTQRLITQETAHRPH